MTKRWRRHASAAVLAAGALAVAPSAGALAGTHPGGGPELLMARSGGQLARLEATIAHSGGEVLAAYPVADTVLAEPGRATRLPAGVHVVRNAALHVSATANADSTAPSAPVDATIGASAGATGAGVTVAVVDTGITQVPQLAGKVVGAVDVAGGNGSDGYGHGTFMAGLIAGSTTGVAPGASLFDVRVADGSGNTSLSMVLAGLQAVADRARSDPSLRVLNLSLSTRSPLPGAQDPLAVALDRLWRSGISVVVPAGNDGPAQGSVEAPGNDPTLLTVGALDANGTVSRADDAVADFSGRGPAADGAPEPDLVAPGVHVVSLADPGSEIYTQYPAARLPGGLFRGSGTSMSTAITSGAVADLLSARPGLTPDQVKSLLMATAYRSAGLTDPNAAGAGGLDLGAALRAPAPQAPTGGPAASHPDAAAWSRFASAWQQGNQAAAKAAWAQLSPGTQQWASRAWADAVAAQAISQPGRAGEVSQAEAWVAPLGTAASTWSADQWLARSWSARSWSDLAWAARSWSARSWSARSWSARSWSARSWSARSWSARSWSARSWSARSWSARSWSASSW